MHHGYSEGGGHGKPQDRIPLGEIGLWANERFPQDGIIKEVGGPLLSHKGLPFGAVKTGAQRAAGLVSSLKASEQRCTLQKVSEVVCELQTNKAVISRACKGGPVSPERGPPLGARSGVNGFLMAA